MPHRLYSQLESKDARTVKTVKELPNKKYPVPAGHYADAFRAGREKVVTERRRSVVLIPKIG